MSRSLVSTTTLVARKVLLCSEAAHSSPSIPTRLSLWSRVRDIANGLKIWSVVEAAIPSASQLLLSAHGYCRKKGYLREGVQRVVDGSQRDNHFAYFDSVS